MSEDVLVPKWGLTADEMILTEWLCQVGDMVEEGQVMAELETDKVDGELPVPVTGKVEELLVSPGDIVNPGQIIARIRSS